MRHFYNAIIGACSVLFLWGAVEAAGTEQPVKTRIDSTVVDLGNGDVVVKYSIKPFDFGALHHPDPSLFLLKRRRISVSMHSEPLKRRLLWRESPRDESRFRQIILIMLSERFR